MNKKAKIAGLVLAVGAASMFAMAPGVATAASGKLVHCSGVNACKGKGSCKTANSCKGQNACKGKNACKGQNACKGKGVVGVSKGVCEQLGGTVEK